jgi:VanZ family protein
MSGIKFLKTLLLLLTIFLFMTIYYLSDRTAPESRQDSARALVILRLVTEEDVENNTAEYRRLQTNIRIFGHFTLFAALSLSLYCLILIMTKKILLTGALTFLLVILAAILDEKHQILVDGRSFELFDIYVDIFGGLLVLVSAVSVSFVSRLIYRKKLKRNRKI